MGWGRVETSTRAVSDFSDVDAVAEIAEGVDGDTAKLVEKLKDGEQEKLVHLQWKADIQLGRMLTMASTWSRILLSLQGKLKGTQWDPENSHRIGYSEFRRLLDSNHVHFMEYSNYGQTVSVILPYYKDGKPEYTKDDSRREIIFRRHVVDCMPIDCWNDVWNKLHQQLINVNVTNVNPVSAEVYSTIATAVFWSMRLTLAIGLYFSIDRVMQPIYAKLIPCDLGKSPEKVPRPLKRHALGSLGKSRFDNNGCNWPDFASLVIDRPSAV